MKRCALTSSASRARIVFGVAAAWALGALCACDAAPKADATNPTASTALSGGAASGGMPSGQGALGQGTLGSVAPSTGVVPSTGAPHLSSSAGGAIAPSSSHLAASPPSLESWEKTAEATVEGSSRLACETKLQPGWFWVRCGKNASGEPVEVRDAAGKVLAAQKDDQGRLTFSVPYHEGVALELTVAWTKGAFRLTATWPAGKPRPQVVGRFAPVLVGGVDTAPMKLAELSPSELPASVRKDGVEKYEGNVEHGAQWWDKSGRNIALFVKREKSTADNNRYEMDALHFVISGAATTLSRKVFDFVECPKEVDIFFELLERSVSLADSDADGLGELLFIYDSQCTTDVSPATRKLIVLEAGDKYVLRGTSVVADGPVDARRGAPAQTYGGEFTVGDPEPPPDLSRHMQKVWLEFAKPNVH